MGFIVVGLDGSHTARRAFHEAVREAEWRECSILAVNVVVFALVAGHELGMADIEELKAGGHAFLDKELAELGNEYEGGIPVAVDRHVAVGHTGVELIKAAEGPEDGPHADLVVLGSRGHGGFRGLLLGSVTTYAVHHLPCRLLIVPAED